MGSEAKRYRVFFHEGEAFPAVIRVPGGQAWLDETGLHIEGEGRALSIPIDSFISAELYRRGGSMNVIRLRHSGGCIHLAVVRFMIGGIFAVVNVFATRELHERLARLRLPSRQPGL